MRRERRVDAEFGQHEAGIRPQHDARAECRGDRAPFIKPHPMPLPPQHQRRTHAGYAGAQNRNLHPRSLSFIARSPTRAGRADRAAR